MEAKDLNKYYTQAFSSIRHKSKRRGEPYPDITKNELIKWLNSNGLNQLWDDYKESGFAKDLKPSIDRIDPYKGYSFDNMQLITWEENRKKGVNSKKHHLACHNKQNKKRIKLVNPEGEEKYFESAMEGAKYLGCHVVSISRVLSGERKTIMKHKAYYALTGEELKIK